MANLLLIAFCWFLLCPALGGAQESGPGYYAYLPSTGERQPPAPSVVPYELTCETASALFGWTKSAEYSAMYNNCIADGGALGYKTIAIGYSSGPYPECPAGQTRVAGVCVTPPPPPPQPCPDGQERVDGQCVPKCPPQTKRIGGKCVPLPCPSGVDMGMTQLDGEVTQYFCMYYLPVWKNCTVRVNPSVCVDLGPEGGGSSCHGTARTTGSECSPSSDPAQPTPTPGSPTPGSPTPSPVPPNPEPVPKPGEPRPSPPLPEPQPVPPSPDGTCPAGSSKSASGACIKNPSPPDAAGKCPAGTVPVGSDPPVCVYTSPAPSGSGTGTGTGSGTGGGCTGDGCGTGTASVWGGACSTGFTCSGDAVQCAAAKEQHRRNCAAFEDFSSDEAKAYLGAKAAAAASEGPSSGAGSSTVSIGPADFDSSDALGAGASCISDKTVTVMGSPVTLPFSGVCSYLALLGNILLGVSWLLAARIVSRG